jgi:transposase
MPDRQEPYPGDLSDAERAAPEPLLPPPARTGRPRKWPRRLMAEAILHLVRSGRAWRMPPREFPPWRSVHSRFARWRRDGTLRRAHDGPRDLARAAEGRPAEPSAAILDSRTARSTGVGGPARGYDGARRAAGRKRHVLVDTLGLVLLCRPTCTRPTCGTGPAPGGRSVAWRPRACRGRGRSGPTAPTRERSRAGWAPGAGGGPGRPGAATGTSGATGRRGGPGASASCRGAGWSSGPPRGCRARGGWRATTSGCPGPAGR